MWYLKTHVAGVLAKLELRDRVGVPVVLEKFWSDIPDLR
jgi:hypothetical protein